jgi:hypothetical protein
MAGMGAEAKGPFVANHDAPAYQSIDAFINAPIETVWRILSGLGEWPKWNKSVSCIKVNGPIQAGTSLVWKAGSRIVSRLEEVEPPRRIAWSGKTFGIRAIHVWELEKEGEGTRVYTEESFDGIVAWLFRGFARKTLARALE